MTDPIADLLIRIKNASQARHTGLEVPFSSVKERLARLLLKEGYLNKVEVLGKKAVQRKLKIELKYEGKKAMLHSLRRVSKPSCRVYVQTGKISKVRGGVGLVILSTSKGLMSGKEAKEKKLGGELLCEVW